MKIKSKLKYYSNYIFPLLILGISFILKKCKIILLSIESSKITLLVSIAASFVGVLLTILTIYLAVPKNVIRVKQLKESKHQHIYLSNLLTGIILLFISVCIWIFFDNAYYTISNISITIYYTFSLIKIMES